MKTYELIAPCHFGLESVLKREITELGYDVSQVEDGRVTFIGDDEAVCRTSKHKLMVQHRQYQHSAEGLTEQTRCKSRTELHGSH